MAKILVIKDTYFIDPHGTPDFGGTNKFIAEEGDYDSTPEGMYEQYDENVEEEDLQANEDGYNSEAYRYEVKILESQLEIDHAELIIEAYNAL